MFTKVQVNLFSSNACQMFYYHIPAGSPEDLSVEVDVYDWDVVGTCGRSSLFELVTDVLPVQASPI